MKIAAGLDDKGQVLADIMIGHKGLCGASLNRFDRDNLSTVERMLCSRVSRGFVLRHFRQTCVPRAAESGSTRAT